MLRTRFSVVLVAVALMALAGVSHATDPVLTGIYFDVFCKVHFSGAQSEPEIYKAYGNDLKVADDGIWHYISENSAVFGWDSNLPAKTYVAYGPMPNVYYWMTPISDANHFEHLHYLRNLQPNTTYHYQLVTIDERVQIVRSEDRSFTTKRLENPILVPGIMQGPPYVLDKPNATYIVTQDIKADSTAFNITGDGVTLDLGGHTVTYNEKPGDPDPTTSERLYGWSASQGPCGIRTADGKKEIHIVNGTIQQGAGNGTSKPAGYYPVYLYRPQDTEVAGLTVVYAGSQVSGIIVHNGHDGTRVHHNVIWDRGTDLYDRHRGSEAVAFDSAKEVTQSLKCDHNLIKRTRHRGIVASEKTEIFNNEIYIDGYATNSFGIMYGKQGGAEKLAIHHNRVYGTGFHPIGIGCRDACSDVQVFANYIQMQGTTEEWRWEGGEGGGDKDAITKSGIYPVNGIRLQAPKDNIHHFDNVIVVKGSGMGCMMRGLWLVPDAGIGKNIDFRNNRVKVVAEDPFAYGFAVSAGGHGGVAASPSITLEGNVIQSNIVNVQFGDNYGQGGPYLFIGNTFTKLGTDSRYHTIRMGWREQKGDTYGHRFENSTFEGDASFDSVSFDGLATGKYGFSVAWDLDIRTEAGAKVSIKNKLGKVIYTGTVSAKGELVVSLTEYTLDPEAKNILTPHKVTIEKGAKHVTREVKVDKSQTLIIPL
jgi:hypothetical protein